MAEVVPVLVCKKPKRVLSAYNFFFQDQRSKILSGEADDCSVEDDNAAQESSCAERNGSGSEDVLKSTGPRKVEFKSLGKSVGRRWRRLAPEDRVEFERAAAADKERYAKEMAAYKEECKALKRKQTQTETMEKKQKLETTRTDDPNVIQRSEEIFSSQIEPSFNHSSTDNPSEYSRDGVGYTGHFSRQLPYYSAQWNDNHPYWYGHTAAGSHHGGGHYSTGMPYYSAAPPPYSSHPPRYHNHNPRYAASHSEEIANSYPNNEVGSHHGGQHFSTGMPHYSEATLLYSSRPTRYDSGYTPSYFEDTTHSYTNNEAGRLRNLSVSSNQAIPLHDDTIPFPRQLPYPQQTIYSSYPSAFPEVSHYEIPPQQQAYWTSSSYPHTEQSRYGRTSWNHSNDNENTQNSYDPREAQHAPGNTNWSNDDSV